MVDVNNLVASANINITKKQNVLGLIANIDGENRGYFSNISIGNSITSVKNEQSMQARKYLIGSMIKSLDLRDIFIMAGATVVDKQPDSGYYDLSPEMLDKTTIINLAKP